jgi:hypothetical protein
MTFKVPGPGYNIEPGGQTDRRRQCSIDVKQSCQDLDNADINGLDRISDQPQSRFDHSTQASDKVYAKLFSSCFPRIFSHKMLSINRTATFRGGLILKCYIIVPSSAADVTFILLFYIRDNSPGCAAKCVFAGRKPPPFAEPGGAKTQCRGTIPGVP